MKPLNGLVRAIGAATVENADAVVVTGICEDSRRLEPGDLFVAIPGTAHDGTGFADDAVARGAVAVVAERPLGVGIPAIVVPDARRALAALSAAFFDAPTEQLRTVGVTGTNGKTTVCHWIAHLLGSDGTEVIGTVANEARGLPAVTTPPSPIVQRIARDAAEAGKENLVIEASSIGLAQRRLEEVAFGVAAFTNLGHDHLDLHESRAAYLADKARLFRSLRPEGRGVVNADDPHAAAIAAAAVGRILTVGRSGGAELRAVDVRDVGGRIRFLVARGREKARVELPIVGPGSVENALVAAGVGLVLGLDLDEVADRLKTVPPIPGRWVVFRSGTGTTAVVDFAHNPEALRAALEALRGACDRLVAVFGCPGGSDREKRPTMGEISGRLADLTILTADNPKEEAPESIAEEIAVGVRRAGGRAVVQIDRTAAIRRGVTAAGPGGAVLVAGKGHEGYQIVRGRFVPYSDLETLVDLGFRPVETAGGGRGPEEDA